MTARNRKATPNPKPDDDEDEDEDAGVAPAASLLLTPLEAAALLRIGRTSLYELVWQGRIKPVHIGRSVRFPRSRVEAFVRELEIAAGGGDVSEHRKAS